MPPFVTIVAPLACAIAGIFALVQGYRAYKEYRLIKDVPRSAVRSLAMGIVEIHGKVKSSGKMLVSPFTKAECVYFKYKVEERRRSGGKQPRTYWATIASGSKFVPFLAQDETGTVLVDPSGAEFNTPIRQEYRHKAGLFGGFRRFFDALDKLRTGDMDKLDDVPMEELEPVDPGDNFNWYSVGDRRYREYYLCNAEPLFLIGTAAMNTTDNSMVIARGENNPTFIISDRTEAGMLKQLRKSFLLYTGASLILILIGLYIMLKANGLL